MKIKIIILIYLFLLNTGCNAQQSDSLDFVLSVLEKNDSASFIELNKTVNYLKEKRKGKELEDNKEQLIKIAWHIIKQNREIERLKTEDNKKIKDFCSDTTELFFTKEISIVDFVKEEGNKEKLKLKIIYNELKSYKIQKNYFENIPNIKEKISILESTTILSNEQKKESENLILSIRNDFIRLESTIDDIKKLNIVTVEKLEELKELCFSPIQIKYLDDYIKQLKDGQ